MPFIPWTPTAGSAPTPLPVSLGGTGATTAAGAAAGALAMAYNASTSAQAGYTLVNGTGNIATFTVPSDGNVHTVNITTMMNVTVAETGGVIQVTFTLPDNTAQNFQQHAGGLGTGLARNEQSCLCRSGTTVTLLQNTALTAGAATLWYSFWVN